MLAGAVVPIRSGFLTALEQTLVRVRVTGHVDAALEVGLGYAHLGLETRGHLNVQIGAFMGGAGQGKLTRDQTKVLDAATLNEWERLERLG
jgi:hypothetical protein